MTKPVAQVAVALLQLWLVVARVVIPGVCYLFQCSPRGHQEGAKGPRLLGERAEARWPASRSWRMMIIRVAIEHLYLPGNLYSAGLVF